MNSIQDGLQVTPGNVTTAKYMDITYLEDTPLQYLTWNDTIDVIEGDAESAQKFNEILQFASTDAPIQQVVDLENEFADQYYVEWDIEDDSSFRRTALYADPTENTMTNLTTRASNTSQNYNITEYGNIIKVDITANASNFYAMAMEPIQ